MGEPRGTQPDPWAVLGLGPGASLQDARSARRRLAKRLHPDLHEAADPAEAAARARHMALVNQAMAEVERLAATTDPATTDPAAPTQRRHPPRHPPAGAVDGDSFSVGALPVEAFEALFLVAYGLGEILVAEEPYTLELYLLEPAPCFCQLILVPEAGSSLVTVDVTPAEGSPAPPVDAVRDLLVAELNGLA
jgi:hypothetical protein